MGKMYGVGVGPGDPELLTLKAIRVMKEADCIVVPGEEVESSVAFSIAKVGYPEVTKKKVFSVSMPMTKDKEVLKKAHEEAILSIKEKLESGQIVAFLTLGDPTIYSTYMYLHKKITELGFETEIVSGIPSFCAAAARLGISLVENREQMHIIPATYGIDEVMHMSGTKVLMKAGRKVSSLKEEVKKMGARAMLVENCGMKNEKLYTNLEMVPEKTGYYTVLIVKEK
jgi:precorrin-2 C(20)-methyltransferase